VTMMAKPNFAPDISRLGIFPLCVNQESVLVHRAIIRQSSGSPPPSLIRFGLRLEGHLQLERLQEALSHVIGRHPALRLSFADNIFIPPPERKSRFEAFRRTGIFEPGLFMQTVHEEAALPILEFDWAAMHQAELEVAISSLIQKEDSFHFKDSAKSRVRVSVVRASTTQSLVILTFDHLAFDGFSIAIIRQELEYFLCGQSSCDRHRELAASGLGFPGFAAWQNRVLPTPYFRSSMTFWRDQWAKFAPHRIPCEDLPFSRPAPQRPDSSFATEHGLFSKSDSVALKAFAIRAKNTVFAIFLAAFAIVLSEYTGRSSVVIWSHLLNRVQPRTTRSVGFFNNSHILGIDLPSQPTGFEIIRYVGSVVRAALAHQELPLPYLWSALKCCPRFPDAHVLMDFRTIPAVAIAGCSSGLKVERLSLPDPTTPRFSSLGVYVIDNSETIQLSVTYWSCRFSQPGVERLLRDLHSAVLNLMNDPGAICRRPRMSDHGPSSTMEEFLLLQSMSIPRGE
jgi:hypothetical protein